MPLRTLVFLSLVLTAQRTAAEPPAAKDADIYDVVAYVFGDDQVLGDGVAPMGEILHVRRKPGKSSLVRARGSFVDKLVRTIENF